MTVEQSALTPDSRESRESALAQCGSAEERGSAVGWRSGLVTSSEDGEASLGGAPEEEERP